MIIVFLVFSFFLFWILFDDPEFWEEPMTVGRLIIYALALPGSILFLTLLAILTLVYFVATNIWNFQIFK
jgi:hypothetical protein